MLKQKQHIEHIEDLNKKTINELEYEIHVIIQTKLKRSIT